MAKRILIVDDEPELLFSMSELLGRAGYDVLPAQTGSQALELLVESPPDLIISDILMGEMDGFEFQRRANSLTGNSIPFIFLTARSDLHDRVEGLRAGADDYVIKPFEPLELEARIASILSRMEQIRQEERRDMDNLRQRILTEISSKLRAPVASLTSHLNLLLTERFGQDENRKARYLESVMRDADTLRNLISELSWVTGEVDGQASLKREPIRVAPVVRGAAANAARLASERGVDLGISCGGLLSANMDGEAMTRALTSLLQAAIELAPRGGQVTISAVRAAEGGLEVVISDGGSSEPASGRMGDDGETSQDLEAARNIIKAHGGQFSWRREQDGRDNLVIWLPGRIAKRIGQKR